MFYFFAHIAFGMLPVIRIMTTREYNYQYFTFGRDDTDTSVILFQLRNHIVILDWYMPEVSEWRYCYYWKWNWRTKQYDFRYWPPDQLLNNPISSSSSSYDAIEF